MSEVTEELITVEDVLTPEKSPKASKPRKKAKQDEYYVNPKEFLEELKTYYRTNVISDNLATMITKIAEGLSYRANFINYSYRDEFVGDALVKMSAALRYKKFKIDSNYNPFSYFTTIAFHAFINRIKREKKHHQTITDYQEQVYTELLTSGEGQGAKSIYVDPSNGYDGEDE